MCFTVMLACVYHLKMYGKYALSLEFVLDKVLFFCCMHYNSVKMQVSPNVTVYHLVFDMCIIVLCCDIRGRHG